MNIIKYSDYDNIKKDFFRKHKNDFTIDTTGNSAEYYINSITNYNQL